jgi:hypothetical protein
MDDADNADFPVGTKRRDEAIMDHQSTISEKTMRQASAIERQVQKRYQELLTSPSNVQIAKDAALREALSRIAELEERIRGLGENSREQDSQGVHGRLRDRSGCQTFPDILNGIH